MFQAKIEDILRNIEPALENVFLKKKKGVCLQEIFRLKIFLSVQLLHAYLFAGLDDRRQKSMTATIGLLVHAAGKFTIISFEIDHLVRS